MDYVNSIDQLKTIKKYPSQNDIPEICDIIIKMLKQMKESEIAIALPR